MINMLFVGLWHGANWTFFVFGLYHGLLFIPLMLTGQFFKRASSNQLQKGIPGFNGISKIAFTYLLVTIGQFIFRSPSISEAFSIIKHIPFSCNGGLFYDLPTMANAFICIVVLIYVDIKEEWFGNKYLKLPKYFEHWRWDLTIAIGIVVILLFGVFDNNQFIYFQF